ncbi:MAG TPA: hypothetical protein PLR06_01125 [Cyclobacteriaceae bacterium]|nr:hypothetical protein [Cyclobacteriaceae bacterium]
MSIRNLRFYLVIVISIASLQVFGQAAKSPFSSFGLGEQFGYALAPQQGMGGVGISNPQYWYINNLNPALLVFNRFTTFQAGFVGEQRTQLNDTQSGKSGSGNLNYLALSIPVKISKWTSSISLMPYTRLNYEYRHTESIDGTTANTVNVTESGTGGINQFSWSNGVAVTRWASVGLRASYLFSSTNSEYSSQLTNTTQLVTVYPQVVDRTFVSDFLFSPAISIHLDSISKKNYKLNIGLVYDFKTNLNTQFNERLERWGSTGRIDSLTVINNQKGTITIPSSLALGISFGLLYKWTVGIDGYYSNYSDYRYINGANPYGQNNWKINAGFEIIPDVNSLGSYLKRTTYRTGVSLENYPYLVNGNAVKDFGITFGFSLPVGRFSYLDLAIKAGKKGDKAINTVEENYFKIYFGMTLNDQWFIKRRFD